MCQVILFPWTTEKNIAVLKIYSNKGVEQKVNLLED